MSIINYSASKNKRRNTNPKQSENKKESTKFVHLSDSEKNLKRKRHYIEMALSLDNDNILLLNKKGIICYNSKDYEEAIKCFDIIIKSKSTGDLFTVYFNKSLCLREKQEFEKAYNCIVEGLNYHPNNALGHKLKTELLILLKQSTSKSSISSNNSDLNPKSLKLPKIEKESNTGTSNEIKNEFKSVTNEKNGFLHEIQHLVDKHGIQGREIFDLTLDNQNSKASNRLVSLKDGDRAAKGMFHALCPELESFITVTNWMGPVNEKKSHRIEAQRKFMRYIQEGKKDEVCKIKGNFRIKNPDFSTVLLYRAETEVVQRDSDFYDWERVPFLKRSAEVFDCVTPYGFMSTIKSSGYEVVEERVVYFTSLFKLKNVTNNIANITVLSSNMHEDREAKVLVHDPQILSSLKKDADSVFEGLFIDKLSKKQENSRAFELLDVSDKMYGNDISAHIISQKLYYNYLKDMNLHVTSKKSFSYICNKVFKDVENMYNEKVDILSFDLFWKLFLERYFVEYNDQIYYKPFVIKGIPSDKMGEFSYYLYTDKSELNNDLLKARTLHQKYWEYEKRIDFLNKYNRHSKINLIAYVNLRPKKWIV